MGSRCLCEAAIAGPLLAQCTPAVQLAPQRRDDAKSHVERAKLPKAQPCVAGEVSRAPRDCDRRLRFEGGDIIGITLKQAGRVLDKFGNGRSIVGADPERIRAREGIQAFERVPQGAACPLVQLACAERPRLTDGQVPLDGRLGLPDPRAALVEVGSQLVVARVLGF